MKKVIFSADEMNWLINSHKNWIESTEKTEHNLFLVDLKDYVTPTQLFDAGKSFQLDLINKNINNEN
jgi:hypothetical protein